MAKYMVVGEISTMSAALRRAMRYSHQNEHLEELIKSFSSLKDILSRQSDLSDLEPSIYFSPFLDVVRSGDTNGTITAMALTAVTKFLQYGLIDHNLESAAATAEQIVHAMKKISYITEDAASDKIVLMKFLRAIRSLLLSQVGCLLSNSGACELIQAIIKIIFDPGFGVSLKEMAEQTWGEVVQLMFARLPQFSEDVEDLQLKQLRIKGTIDLRTQRRRSAHTKHKHTKSKEADDLPFNIGEAREDAKSVTNPITVPQEIPQVQNVEENVQPPETVVEEPETLEKQIGADSTSAEPKPDESSLSDSVEVLSGDQNIQECHVMNLGGSVNSLDEVGQSEEIVNDGSA
ncbi:Golgi-specific brefeldin A-resistance guanine nucleotide exchange factor 1, partial [Galendromus occidentalis]|uniref:Golgi-specific brefeldin A-resistance guanine nucleotide exchange factor 1 n=1 Tax=Galendromus occidentalis TaxID=34638 RepID=A0AAJ6QS78_9ACAR